MTRKIHSAEEKSARVPTDEPPPLYVWALTVLLLGISGSIGTLVLYLYIDR